MIFLIVYGSGSLVGFCIILSVAAKEQKKLLVEDLWTAFVVALCSWFGVLAIGFIAVRGEFGKQVIWEEKEKKNVDNNAKR